MFQVTCHIPFVFYWSQPSETATSFMSIGKTLKTFWIGHIRETSRSKYHSNLHESYCRILRELLCYFCLPTATAGSSVLFLEVTDVGLYICGSVCLPQLFLAGTLPQIAQFNLGKDKQKCSLSVPLSSARYWSRSTERLNLKWQKSEIVYCF